MAQASSSVKTAEEILPYQFEPLRISDDSDEWTDCSSEKRISVLKSRQICKKERETRSAVRHGANVGIAKQNFWQVNAYAVSSWVKREK